VALWVAQKFLLETRFGGGPLRPGGRPQPPRFRPAARDFGGDGQRGGTAERLHQPRGADGQILQYQRSQSTLAALILEWLGNGHGTRFILGLMPLLNLQVSLYAELTALQKMAH